MRTAALLLLCLGLSEGAFVVLPTSTFQKAPSSLNAQQQMDRRSLLSAGFIATSASLLGRVAPAAADDDIFEEFEKGLKGWPHSPSPLPTTVKTASELTSPTTNFVPAGLQAAEQAAEEGMQAMSDLEKMLQESSQKRQVGPRTHG